MGPRPKGTTLDRIDGSKGYSPENCRWSYDIEQATNRSSTRIILAFGEERSVSEWSRVTGIPNSLLLQRLNRGLPPEEAIEKGIPERSKKLINSEKFAWRSMVARCTNPDHAFYKNYGGRGIFVCDRWIESFENFMTDMGAKPGREFSLDRIDVNSGYSPENCRWATHKQQARNKRTSRMLEAFGKSQSAADWSEEAGIPSSAILWRIRIGWSVERAVTEPVKNRKRW